MALNARSSKLTGSGILRVSDNHMNVRLCLLTFCGVLVKGDEPALIRSLAEQAKRLGWSGCGIMVELKWQWHWKQSDIDLNVTFLKAPNTHDHVLPKRLSLFLEDLSS